MASLSEMLDYARAKQQTNPIADIAGHFIEGASSGYDAGHAEALKKAERDANNPTINVDGKPVRLDVYSKLLDIKKSLMEQENEKLLYDTFRAQFGVQDTSDRTTSLSHIATNAMNASGQTAGTTVADKVAQVAASPTTAGTVRKPTKTTIEMVGGKPMMKLEYGNAERTTAAQLNAIRNYVDNPKDPKTTADLSMQFPEGMPDWATKFMAQHGEMKAKRDAVIHEQEVTRTHQSMVKLSDALDPSKNRQGAFGVSKQVFDRAERLQSLASAFPDGNLDSRQIEELAIGLNAMLSGSNTGAQEQVKSLVPKTIWGNAQKTAEWLTNNPRGTQQRAFVNRMLGSIDREKETASGQIRRTQLSRIAPYSHLEQKDPETFYATLQSQGIEPTDYEAFKKGGRKQASAVVKPGENTKITVSNGKETLMIDASDAEDAAKDGFNPI